MVNGQLQIVNQVHRVVKGKIAQTVGVRQGLGVAAGWLSAWRGVGSRLE
jgi:hypothetical protein